jgi:hypothetical protein
MNNINLKHGSSHDSKVEYNAGLSGSSFAKLNPESQRMLTSLRNKIIEGKAQSGITIDFVDGLSELLSSPRNFNQGVDVTCTQAALLASLAKDNPNELVRIAYNLSINGSVKLKDQKTTLTIEPGSMQKDDPRETGIFSPRNQFEKVMQRAFIAKFSLKDTITNEIGESEAIQGTTPRLAEKMLSAVNGDKFIAISGKNSLGNLLKIAEENGIEEANKIFSGQLVGVQWMDKGKDVFHTLFVNRIYTENGETKVEFYHGWGVHAGLPGPNRVRNDQTGMEVMSWDDFKNRALVVYMSQNSDAAKTYNLKDTLSRLEPNGISENSIMSSLSDFIDPEFFRRTQESSKRIRAAIEDYDRNFLKK